MTYDTVVGGIENFYEISIWSHVTQNVFGARGQSVLIAWLAAAAL